MITEEIVKVMTCFAKGDLITIVTIEDDFIPSAKIIKMTMKHLEIVITDEMEYVGLDDSKDYEIYRSERYKIPWKDISLLAQKGFMVKEDKMPSNRLIDYYTAYLQEDQLEAVALEVLTLKPCKKLKVYRELKERKEKYISFGDPFVIEVDYIKDVLYNRLLPSEVDEALIQANSWYLYSGDKFGILSFDSEIIEANAV